MTKKQIYEKIINSYDDINFYKFEKDYSLAIPETKSIFIGTDISSTYSNDSVFTLLHEIGHIFKDNDIRLCIREYLATVWAINESKNFDLMITDTEKTEWQEYIYICRNKDIDNGLSVPEKNKLILCW